MLQDVSVNRTNQPNVRLRMLRACRASLRITCASWLKCVYTARFVIRLRLVNLHMFLRDALQILYVSKRQFSLTRWLMLRDVSATRTNVECSSRACVCCISLRIACMSRLNCILNCLDSRIFEIYCMYWLQRVINQIISLKQSTHAARIKYFADKIVLQRSHTFETELNCFDQNTRLTKVDQHTVAQVLRRNDKHHWQFFEGENQMQLWAFDAVRTNYFDSRICIRSLSHGTHQTIEGTVKSETSGRKFGIKHRASQRVPQSAWKLVPIWDWWIDIVWE